ncbi:MAG: hypothetical protein CMJ73_02910 [Planctomycetaceae bacterium]|nr:hypothetical protein [Planctomycetaceae bacterium]
MKQVSRTSEKWNEMPFVGTTRNGNDFLEEITMVKKVAIGGGVALLVVLLLFGRSTYSYFSTTVSRVHDSVKSTVPVDFELDRARKETSRIMPEVRKNMHVIASEEVRVEQLEKRIKTLEEKLSQDQKNLLRLKSDLESGTNNFHYSGVSFTAKEVKQDLENRFDEFTTDEETLKSMVKLLQARTNSLHTARERLAAMQASQRKLKVEIENLEARNKMIQVAQASSEDTFEDSQLSRTRELVDSINSRIRTDEKMLSAESRPMDRIPLETSEEVTDILDRISSYFDSGEEVVEVDLASK